MVLFVEKEKLGRKDNYSFTPAAGILDDIAVFLINVRSDGYGLIAERLRDLPAEFKGG